MRLDTIAKKHLPHVAFSQINAGHCYVWAWIVAAHVSSAKLWADTKRLDPWDRPYAYHAFPRIGNLFFDSDSPQGVRDPASLRCFCVNPRHPEKTVRELCEQHTPKSFWDYWNDASYGGFEYKLDELFKMNRANTAFIRTIDLFNRKHGIRF